ncbi:MAG: FtsQ-type POTRA domain-containing protein, partial [Oscillospiraceae bacterium]|nr:FtsQ-type POTRA domain-containing protein [Oscillospiraceae bacterium]
IMASGIEIGDNMVRLDAEEAESRILASMVYIEKVDISKKYPDTLEITVEKCIPSANAEYDNGTLLLSPKGKILENNQEPQSDLLTVKGLELITYEQGDYIRSADEQKTDIYFDIITALEGCKNSKVVSIDITDKYNIIINYDNRINFDAGNANKIAYKIQLADTGLEDISDDKKGTMVMIGENQISFRGESSASNEVNKSQRVPISEEDLPEGYTEPVTESSEENTEQEYYEENYYEGENSEAEYFEPEYYEDEYSEEYYEEEYYNEGYYEDEFYEEDY